MLKSFVLFAAVAVGSSHALAQGQSLARQLVESGATAYIKEGASSAIAVWLKGSALEGNTQATSQANALRQVEDFYGKPESFETISESTVSSRSKIILFVINFHKGPLYARLQAFQLTSGQWILTEFQFKTEASAIFPTSALYERQ